MTEAIIVALLGLAGTLAGSYLANRKSTALIVYRLEQLEQKVSKHNKLVERTYALEESVALLEERQKVANHRIDDLEKVHNNMGQANYSASKAGIIGLTKATAKELAARNITVNAIAPGFIATEMTDKLNDAVKEAAVKTIPLGEFGKVEDIAETAVFLASDKARYITGQVICVDGGIAM